MFKTLLLSAGLGAYHFLNVLLFQIPQEVIVPTWVEKLSVISILALVIYYLYKENEKQKTDAREKAAKYEENFKSLNDKLFSLELQSLATIKDFQVVLVKVSETLNNMSIDIKELARKDAN